MSYKIQRTDHAKLTQGLLYLCCVLPRFYYDTNASKVDCKNLLNSIYEEALNTKFLRRNNWEPLQSAYNILKTDDRIFIESLSGKAYLEFQIVEVE